jgi:hypothetical protein
MVKCHSNFEQECSIAYLRHCGIATIPSAILGSIGLLISLILKFNIPGLVLLLYLWCWLAFPLELPIKSHVVGDSDEEW